MTEFLTGWTIQILVLVLGVALVVAVMFGVMRALARPQIRILGQELVGQEGIALSDISRREGKVEIAGDRVIAISEGTIPKGSRVRVVKVEGVVAKVEPAA